jgi:hypothetical protein
MTLSLVVVVVVVVTMMTTTTTTTRIANINQLIPISEKHEGNVIQDESRNRFQVKV